MKCAPACLALAIFFSAKSKDKVSFVPDSGLPQQANFSVHAMLSAPVAVTRSSKICGATGIRVQDPSELDGALERAFSCVGPAMVEILTDAALV